MSRIGLSPILIPEGVTINVSGTNVNIKGPKGELNQKIDSDFKIKIDESNMTIARPSEQKRHKSLHGLYRSLINNCVVGVSEGYELKLELVGVGFKASSQGNLLNLSLGFSHNIYFDVPQEVKLTIDSQKGKAPIIILNSIDKQLIGQIAAKLKSFRPVEPYKGKGVKFVGEFVRRKVGKTAAA
jgi:large subunit ribosomal protein L6|tara:strand:- start:886 stop:1437 length:552 start_codon:yes stop_codon:yes gene_type:complete